jgi:hypothetical protein
MGMGFRLVRLLCEHCWEEGIWLDRREEDSPNFLVF